MRELSDGASRARDAAWARSALSRACHAHAYELEPTRHEVSDLLDQVAAVVDPPQALNPSGP